MVDRPISLVEVTPRGLAASDFVNLSRRLRSNIPGMLLAFGIGALSLYIEASFGGPVMLYALVLGGLCHTAAAHPLLRSGVETSSNTLLKIGVALLGVKITILDIANLGYVTAALVLLGVTSTMMIGTMIGRALGLKLDHAVLSSGSVAICGSSAALAIASVLPQNKNTECNTIVTVITVTALSTVAMVLYPVIAAVLDLSDTQAGTFIGLTIHNVAQVVGAGFMISDPAGETATIVKLMRVACLLPVIMIVSFIFQSKTRTGRQSEALPLLPTFMVGFIVIMLMNSIGLIPESVSDVLGKLSRWALVIAVAALGVKTSVKDLISVGCKPILVLTAQTFFLAVLALVAIGLFIPA